MTTPQTILVVDDDVDFLEQTTLSLNGEGFNIVTAGSQAEAEEALLSVSPALCILDLMMENQDSGFVLCHAVKRLHPEAKVILLTAVKSATGLDFAARSQEGASWIKADALLDKPVRPEQLRQEVRRLLGTAA
jgi:CheY-like chemotaxis protein